MKKIIKICCGILAAAGFLLMMCACSTLDHPGSIPVTLGQILIMGLVGGLVAIVSATIYQLIDV